MTKRIKKSPVRLAKKTAKKAQQDEAKVAIEEPKIEVKEEPKAEEEPKVKEEEDSKPEVEEEPTEEKKEPRLGNYDDMPGYIEDPINVFKLAMLESKMKQNLYEKEVLLMRIDGQMKALQAKRNELLLHHDRLHRNFDQAIVNQGRYLEEKHKIGLRYYTYNDETGVLTKQEKKE